MIIYYGSFLFWFNLLGVMYASYIFIGISFFRLEEFSSMTLLKIVSMPLTFKSSLSFILIIFKYGLLTISQSSWIFCNNLCI